MLTFKLSGKYITITGDNQVLGIGNSPQDARAHADQLGFDLFNTVTLPATFGAIKQNLRFGYYSNVRPITAHMGKVFAEVLCSDDEWEKTRAEYHNPKHDHWCIVR